MGVPSAADHDAFLEFVPLARTLGIRLEAAGKDEVTGWLDWSQHLCTAGGVLHGGALMSVADTVGALVAVLNVPGGARTTTIESKTNFFRAVTGGSVRAVARPLHTGKRTIVVRTELFDDDDRLVGHVVQTQAVLPPAEPEEPQPVG
jgi:1,4-dihydroxy-2-naphthoyl-CoA hydrolase